MPMGSSAMTKAMCHKGPAHMSAAASGNVATVPAVPGAGKRRPKPKSVASETRKDRMGPFSRVGGALSKMIGPALPAGLRQKR